MRIVKRPELMEMIKEKPVIYSEIYDYDLEGLYIASHFCDADFATMNLLDELEDDEMERWDIIDKAKSDSNFHFELSMNYFGREGLFKDEHCYAVYEKEDLEKLIKRLQGFL